MSMDSNPYASPRSVGQLPLGAPAGAGAWRSGPLLVVGHDAQLPDLCIKCNRPAGGRRMRFRLAWHPPIAYVGLLLGLLPFVLIAVVTQKKLTVHVGVCDEHLRKRRLGILVGFLAGLAGILLIVMGAIVNSGAVAIVGLVVFVAAVLYGIVTSRIVWPKKIDKHCAWVKGACPEYLEIFPEGIQPSHAPGR